MRRRNVRGPTDSLIRFKAFDLIRLATPLQEYQLLIIYCSPRRQLPGYLYKSPGKGVPHHRPRSLGGVKRRQQRRHLLQTTTASGICKMWYSCPILGGELQLIKKPGTSRGLQSHRISAFGSVELLSRLPPFWRQRNPEQLWCLMCWLVKDWAQRSAIYQKTNHELNKSGCWERNKNFNKCELVLWVKSSLLRMKHFTGVILSLRVFRIQT